MKKTLLTAILVSGTALAFPVYAQTVATSTEQANQNTSTTTETTVEFKQFIAEEKAERAEFRAEVTEEIADLTTRIRSASSTETKESLKQEATERKAEILAEAEMLRAETLAAAKKYIIERANLVYAQFNELIRRADEVTIKITNTIVSLDAAGIDTSDVTITLLQVEENLSSAKSLAANANRTLLSVQGLETTAEIRVQIEQAKQTFAIAKDELALAYADLRTVAAEVRTLLLGYQESTQDNSENETETVVEAETAPVSASSTGVNTNNIDQ